METVSSLTGIAPDDLKCLFCVLAQVPLSFLYRKLPASTEQQRLVRKVYGVAVALASNLYCFDFWGNVVFVFCTVFSYSMSLQCTSKRRAFLISFGTFASLCVANVVRLVVDYEGNANNVSLLFMVLTPRMIYFNWTACGHYEAGRPEQIPALADFLFYVFNYIGGLIGPVFTYDEFDAFIRQSHPEESLDLRRLAEAAGDVAGMLTLFLAGARLYDYHLVERPEFADLSLLFQIGAIVLEAVLIRARYIAVWRIESLHVVAANVRDSEAGYGDYLQTVQWRNIELENSSRVRIENWNMSIQKWLRNCFYLPAKEVLGLPAPQASMLTFVVSAFWHGFYPVYYFCFLNWNLISEAEKMVFKCPPLRAYFPSFVFRFLMDAHGLLFKRFLSRNFWPALWNMKLFVAAVYVLFFGLKVACPAINKRFGVKGDRPKKTDAGQTPGTEEARAEGQLRGSKL